MEQTFLEYFPGSGSTAETFVLATILAWGNGSSRRGNRSSGQPRRALALPLLSTL